MYKDDELLKRYFFEFSVFNSRFFTYTDEFEHIWITGSSEVPPDTIDTSHECYYKNEGEITHG